VTKFLRRTYMGLILFFLYVPVLLLVVFSFNASKSRGVWGGFTLQWYVDLFKDRAILAALRNTLVIGLLAAAISTLVGAVGAIGLYQLRRGWRQGLMGLVNLPMLNSEIVTGVSLMLLYTAMNLELGFLTLVLSHVAFCIPYVVLSVLPKLRQLDPHLPEAAQDLGATPTQAFFKVILPDIMPGIFSGFLLALTMSIDDFVISFFTTGMGVQNLSITVYTMAKRGISPKINALSTIIFVVVLGLLAAVNLPDLRRKNAKASRPPV
jgi:spermidine/putrescine transport system permease protein